MKRFAVLAGNKEVLEVCDSFDAAKKAAKDEKAAQFVRPVDEEQTEFYDEIIVEFGNCNAFAIE